MRLLIRDRDAKVTTTLDAAFTLPNSTSCAAQAKHVVRDLITERRVGSVRRECLAHPNGPAEYPDHVKPPSATPRLEPTTTRSAIGCVRMCHTSTVREIC